MALAPTPVSTDRAAPAMSAAAPERRGLVARALEHRVLILAVVALVALTAGGILHLLGEPGAGDAVWTAQIVLLAAELCIEVLHTIFVEHHLGVDAIALVAMLGALALGELLAGAIVGLMFTGGGALEDLASTRARRDLTALLKRAPTFARLIDGGQITRVPVDQVAAGDHVMVGTGEVVPVDGALASAEAVIDTSALTGESLPVSLTRGGAVLSGTANAGPPIEVRADRPASASAYAALVRLVAAAQANRAPFVRMADRYAGIFLPVTMLVAGAAWAASGDPVRALAVVVVATPCPLILAAPIAFVCGLSRAARAGVIVKGAGAIEALGRARTILFDKTGTLTVGTPAVRDVVPAAIDDPDEILALAASLDQASAHVLGEALVRAAAQHELTLVAPDEVRESPGQGIVGIVAGRHVVVGSRLFMAAAGVPEADITQALARSGHGSGEAHVLVGVEGALAGVIIMADEPRPGTETIMARLREQGVRHIALVSGDRRSVAERIGRALGVDRVYAEQTPEDKLSVVQALRDRPDLAPVVMVGDGVNDAPALALADVGIAMGTAGATVSSETADAVIIVDRIDRLVDALAAGTRAVAIARQSVLAGMGLSMAAMVVAAAGYLPPIAGALLQEGIDLAVILNALRALRG